MAKVKKRIWIVVSILIFLLSSNFVFRYFYNEYVIAEYNDQDYSSEMKPLLFGNWFQTYIVHYNVGNIYYQNQAYEDAIYEYQTALELNPDKGKECSIRINLALAIIKTMEEDYDSEENIEDSVNKLKEARSVLLEEECATEAGDGHNETAEQLKSEIEEWLKELEAYEDLEPESKEPQEETESENEEDTYEEEIKEILQEQQSESYQERIQELQGQEELDSDTLFDFNEFIW